MAKALPLLGDAFWVVAGDVFVPGFRFDPAAAQAFARDEDWARIWLVPNPAHVPQGDFALNDAGRVLRKDQAPAGIPTGTYATIGLYKPAMVAGVQAGEKAALRPSLERAIDAGKLAGQWHHGPWVDVGTPQRLAALNAATPGDALAQP
jgi:MurNAc alpha-1-phosphate uridylyltransferase